MLKINCDLTIEIDVECPHCYDFFDLFNIEWINDDGDLYKDVFSDRGWGCSDFNKVVECPKCKTEFKIGAINW